MNHLIRVCSFGLTFDHFVRLLALGAWEMLLSLQEDVERARIILPVLGVGLVQGGLRFVLICIGDSVPTLNMDLGHKFL